MNEKQFLEKQLEIRRQIKNGEASWNDLNTFRVMSGRQPVNPDTLRKGAFLLDEYDALNCVRVPEDFDVEGLNLRTTVCMDNTGNITYDNKLAWLNSSDFKDEEAILLAYGFSPREFQLVNIRTSSYASASDDTTGKCLYAGRITIKPKVEELSLSDIEEHFAEYFSNYSSPIVEPKQYEFGAECLVPCFLDLHFGKLACIGETGDKYDYKIAKHRFLNGLAKFITKLEGRKFEKIIFPMGNDFFNSENDGETTGGTKQDNDTRPTKMFEKGVETLIEGIDMLSNIAPVEVLLVPGNHDFMTSFYAACVLSAKYQGSTKVTIDKQPITRKYVQFGTNLLGFTHGSEEKDRIYGLMQHEVPEMWGNTTTREWIIGHLHFEAVTEKNGVIVRRIPSLTGTDAWHQKCGFTTSKKRAIALIYDKEEGLSESHYINI